MSFINYLKNTKTELKHVNWPTRAQAIGYTVVVIIFSAVIALLLGAFDYIFAEVLKKLIS